MIIQNVKESEKSESGSLKVTYKPIGKFKSYSFVSFYLTKKIINDTSGEVR